MEPEIIQLGATAVVAISAFKAIEYIVKALRPKEDKDNKQEIEITRLQEQLKSVCDKLHKIENNDLHHLKLDMEANAREHTNIMLLMTAVAGKMGIDASSLIKKS